MPAVTTATTPAGSAAARPSWQGMRNVRPTGLYRPAGNCGCSSAAFSADIAGSQHSTPCRDLGPKDLLQRGDALSLGKHDLGKAAAAVAIEVDLGLAHVGNAPLLQAGDKSLGRKLTVQQAARPVVRYRVRSYPLS